MRELGLSEDRVLIVAELSANHGGSKARALDTIMAAAEAGADAIKLQTYRADTITLDSNREEFRLHEGPWAGRTLYDLYEEAHTPWKWHEDLIAAGNAAGLPVFSTPFDSTAVDFLEELGVPAHKIASFEVSDLGLIERVAATEKPILLSTGMATLSEIDEAVRVIRKTWGRRDPGLVLLKCVSAYPAHPSSMNLRTIPHLAEAFGVPAGLSDHTLGSSVAVTAVALGARVIEKHFTLNRSDGGPDSGFSIEPEEWAEMVTAIRIAEQALGAVRYGPTPGEKESTIFRRSIWVVKPLSAGDRITEDAVRVVRPEHGLEPSALSWVIGRRIKTDCNYGTPLTLDLVD